jgi:hypothetical protein
MGVGAKFINDIAEVPGVEEEDDEEPGLENRNEAAEELDVKDAVDKVEEDVEDGSELLPSFFDNDENMDSFFT